MGSDCYAGAAAPARGTRAGGGVRHAERVEGGGRVEGETAALPGVRVPLRAGARHPPAQGARSGGVGASDDAGVAAAPVRVRQLRQPPS